MTDTSRLDWQDLKIVDAVATERTIRKAATSLGIHHSTVARRLERLEAAMGTSLFERHPEGLLLTSAGEDIAKATSEFASAVIDCERRLSGREDALEGTVSLTVVPVVAQICIAPRLADFASAYPGIEIRLETTTNTLDLSRREADIALRMDNNPPEMLVGRRLFTYMATAYASPGYLRALEAGEAEPRWIAWASEAAVRSAISDFPFADTTIWGECGDITTQSALAKAGFGFAYLPCMCGDLEPGLVRVEGAAMKPGRDVWLLTHPDLRKSAKVRAVLDFVGKALMEDRDLFLGVRGGRPPTPPRP